MNARHCPMAPPALGPAVLVLALGAALAATALAQEVPDRNGSHEPVSSLVLVLNVISETHARPATGVVIRAAAPGPVLEPALVLVPADFVSAGDEIIVLDGGTDILRNGRSSRTVARSAQAGVALLEVEGLERAGVELSSDPWPPEGIAGLEFVAWPAAEALAKGAPLIRYSLQLEGVVIEPATPEVSGPLFDRCGRLAALYLAGDDSRLVAGAAVAGYLASAGFETVQAPCLEAATIPPAAESERPDAIDAQELPALPPAERRPAAGESPPVSQAADKTGILAWAGAAALLALAGLAVWIGVAARKRRPGLWLEGGNPDNPAARLPLRFGARGGMALLRRMSHSISFELSAGQILVSDRGGEESTRLALAVGGTPCLPGEVFIAEPGQEIRLGAERWVLKSDQDLAPAAKETG